LKRSVTIMLAFLVLNGCAYTHSMEAGANRLAGGLNAGLKQSYQGLGVLVAAPVDAASLKAGDFGLLMQELLLNYLAEDGVNVVDVELRRVPYITCENGLVALSRDAAKLKDEYRAEVIIVTSFVERDDDILITSRAVDFTNNDVITGATASIYKTEAVRKLIHPKRPRVYEY